MYVYTVRYLLAGVELPMEFLEGSSEHRKPLSAKPMITEELMFLSPCFTNNIWAIKFVRDITKLPKGKHISETCNAWFFQDLW